MKKNSPTPTPEAKALSLFLMAYKTVDPKYKEQAKRIKKLWSRVIEGTMERDDYNISVQSMLTQHGGYDEVVEKTVRYYIKKSSEWTLVGDDKYCRDAQQIADRILKK